MKNYTLLLVVVILCFITCSKEDKNENLCYSSTLISQVNSGDLAVHGLTYNSNCLIYESTEPFLYKKFSYDTKNSLKKVELATLYVAQEFSSMIGTFSHALMLLRSPSANPMIILSSLAEMMWFTLISHTQAGLIVQRTF